MKTRAVSVGLRLSVLVLAASLFTGCSLFHKPEGGVRITTTPAADVYLDSTALGAAPVAKNPLAAKKYALKLTPRDSSLAPYQTNIKISDGFETNVEWHFASTKEESSGLIVEADTARKKGTAEVEIVTTPDNIPVTVNGENKGFSPLVMDDLQPGEVLLGFQAPGYQPISKALNLTKDKRLIVTVKLARKPLEISNPDLVSTPSATPVASPTAKPKVVATPKPTAKPTTKPLTASGSATTKPSIPKPYIEVLQTPTGFLRVRDLPNTNGKEIGRLQVGDAVPYMGTTTDNWYKIKYAATSSAWISGEYSRLVQ